MTETWIWTAGRMSLRSLESRVWSTVRRNRPHDTAFAAVQCCFRVTSTLCTQRAGAWVARKSANSGKRRVRGENADHATGDPLTACRLQSALGLQLNRRRRGRSLSGLGAWSNNSCDDRTSLLVCATTRRSPKESRKGSHVIDLRTDRCSTMSNQSHFIEPSAIRACIVRQTARLSTTCRTAPLELRKSILNH